MAGIPDSEVDRLKREVSLLRLLESQGHRLVKQGKDWACRCPWHEGDDTPEQERGQKRARKERGQVLNLEFIRSQERGQVMNLEFIQSS
jgi:hypothetical protein